jgi:very-long-chain (3R)-3-hydroxyacyl-CoA dehydratase
MVHLAPPSQQHWAFSLMAASWAAVEVPRYGFYLASLLSGPDGVPGWLTWLRYSLFMVLYPAGISGEIGCLWNCLATVRDERIGEWALPNAHNVAFDYHAALWLALLVAYPPGAYVMFTHMLKQRRKVLGGAAAGKKKTA